MRALLLTLCVALAGVIVYELDSPNSDSRAFEPTLPQAETKQGRAQEPKSEDLLATIIARPLFDPTRRPPDVVSSQNATEPELGDVRLTGIVLEPNRHFAIFAVPDAKPLALSEGEALKGWRLDSILPQKVSLSGPGGIRTLEPKADSKLVRQPPLPAAPAQPQAGAPHGPTRIAEPGQPAAAKSQLPPAPPVPSASKPRPRRSGHDE